MLSSTGIHVIWILDIHKSILPVLVWPFHSAVTEICFTWLTLLWAPPSCSIRRRPVRGPSRSLQLPLLLRRAWRLVFKERGHAACPSSGVCTWKQDICLFAARSRGTGFHFGNKPPFILETDPVFGFAFRAKVVMASLTARADRCEAVSQEGRHSAIA